MRSTFFCITVFVGLISHSFSGVLYGAEPLRGTDGWPMRSHDVRRTGRATVDGPRATNHVWKYTAEDGVVINIEPAVTRDGVFFATWGLTRKHGPATADWDKFDGKVFGLEIRTGKPLWTPLHPGRTAYGYRYDARKPTDQDKPAGEGLHWNYYNGTVEGTPAVDPTDGTLYVGRGDGYLYAVNPRTGRLKWKFRTFDPIRADDPEGGGEIIGGPLVVPTTQKPDQSLIVFATVAAPHRPDPPKKLRHETNAVYAIGRDGKLRWRYPERGTLESVFVAPTAMSLDGQRVYAVTGLPDPKFPCELLALQLDTGQLAWHMALGQFGGQDMAVGADGLLYIAGTDARGLGSKPSVVAVRDNGSSGAFVWGPLALEGLRPPTLFAGGIALHEVDPDSGKDRPSNKSRSADASVRAKLREVFVTTTSLREANGRGGKLHCLDPLSGQIKASWNPEQAEPPCIGGLSDVSLDKSGYLYVGVRGRWKTFTEPEHPGRMYCLQWHDGKFTVQWSLEVAGQIDWASPAIGPNGGLYFGSSDSLSPILFALPRGAQENVKDADPVFYGVLK